MATTYELIVKAVDQSSAPLKRIDKNLQRLERSSRGVNNAFRGIGAVLAGIGLGRVAGDVTNTYRSFERMRTVLQTYMGTQDKANKAMAALGQLANELPQDLEDISQAFVLFKSRGIETTSKSLKAFSNIATANGKSMTQLGEAVADALTGEFERLKEFGIKVSKENDKFVADIGNGQKIIANSTAELTQQLIALGEEGGKFGGAAEAHAQTLDQSISNLTGKVFESKVAFMEGLSPAITDVITRMSELIAKNKEVARELGVNLGEAVKSAAEGINFLIANIDLIRNAIFTVMGGAALNQMTLFFSQMFKGTRRGAGLFKTLGGAIKNIAKALPVIGTLIKILGRFFPITAIITGLVAAFTYFQDTMVEVGKTSASFGEVVGAVFNMLGEGANRVFQYFADIAKTSFDAVVEFVKALPENIATAFNFIGEKSQQVFDYFKDVAKSSFEAVLSFVKAIPENIGKAFNFIGETAQKVFQYLKDVAKTAFENVLSFIGSLPEGFKTVMNNIGELFFTGFTYVKDVVSSAISSVRDYLASAGGPAKEVLEKIANAYRIGYNFILNTVIATFTQISNVVAQLPSFFRESIIGAANMAVEFGQYLQDLFASTFTVIGTTVMNLPVFFVDAFKAVMTMATEFAGAIGQKFSNIFSGIGMMAKGNFSAGFAKMGEEVGYSFADSFNNSFAGVSLKTGSITEEMKKRGQEAGFGFSESFNRNFAGVGINLVDTSQIFEVDRLAQIGERIKSTYGQAATFISGSVIPAFKEFGGNIKGISSELSGAALKTFQNINTSILDMATTLTDTGSAAWQTMKTNVLEWADSVGGFAGEKYREFLAKIEAHIKANRAAKKSQEDFEGALDETAMSAEELDNALGGSGGDGSGGLGGTMDEFGNKTKTLSETITDGIKRQFETLSGNLARSIVKGKGLLQSFKSFFDGILEQMLQAVIQKKIMEPLMNSILGGGGMGGLGGLFGGGGGFGGLGGMLGGLFGGGGGGIFSMIGGLFGFANGGVPSTQRPSIVGEKGPELFMPGTTGRVIPNDDLADSGAGPNVQFNIQAIDSRSGTEFILENKTKIINMINSAQRQRGKLGIID